jgi:hypothetical protein
MQHRHPMAIKDVILVICGIAAVAINFWTAAKPVEAKLVIVRWAIELSCVAAVVGAGYFLIIADNSKLSLACAFYNFFVQAVLFAMSPLPIARRDVLSIVSAGVFFGAIITYGMTIELLKVQSEMVKIEDRTISILEKVYHVLATPTPTPSPTPTGSR